MMKLELKICSTTCATSTFVVNGVPADACDFGVRSDNGQLLEDDDDDDLGCRDMQFISKPPTKEVLAKHKITKADYRMIAGELEKRLSFGGCALCA